ncbi:MAG: hypothetical protein V2A54_17970 [Bacteroidota bacterium]
MKKLPLLIAVIIVVAFNIVYSISNVGEISTYVMLLSGVIAIAFYYLTDFILMKIKKKRES